MAATSPYSPNDYQAVDNFRPYQLPINDIFKAISAQNEFWEIGARKVKAVYDNALSLDLTLDANKEVRKKFMDDANKQLTKLSSMDLSDPSVQRQGFAIYKPLLQDKAVMYDNELTKVMKSIYGDADMYRKKKLSSTGREGEGYTDRNLAFSLDGFEKFTSKLPRDPDMLGELFGKLGKKEFVPYYDPTKEYANIQKLCKGSGGVKQDVATNYMYFDTFSKTGANSSETANCFMMGLSEQAKAQIGIDGWAYYKANPQNLVDDHYDFAYGKYKEQVDAIKGKIAGIKAGGVDKTEEAALKELQNALPELEKELTTRKTEYDEMIGGDAMNYITQNFQTLAKGIYLGKTYNYLGEAFKSDDVSRKLTANAAGIAQFNAIEKSYQQYREHLYNMDEIRLRGKISRQLKKDAGELIIDDPDVAKPVVTDTDMSYGERQFNNEYEIAKKGLDDSYNALSQYMLGLAPDINERASREGKEAFILNFADQHSRKPIAKQDKEFNRLMDIYNKLKDNFSDLDIRRKSVNLIIDNQLNKEQRAKLDEVYDIGGRSIPLKDASAIIPEWRTYYNKFTNQEITTLESLAINGQVYPTGTKEFEKIQSVYNRYHDLIGSYQKTKDQLYGKQYYDAQAYTTPRFNPEKMPLLDNRIRNVLLGPEGVNKKYGYKLLGHSINGRDLYVMPLDEDGEQMSNSEVDKTFNAAHGRDTNISRKKIGKDNVIVIPNVLDELPDVPSQQQQMTIGRLRDFQTLMEHQLKNKGGYFSSEDLKNTDGTTFPYSNITFQTPAGANVRVKAVVSNGETRLIPSVQRIDGTWNTNYQSFATPEELVLFFRMDRPKP